MSLTPQASSSRMTEQILDNLQDKMNSLASQQQQDQDDKCCIWRVPDSIRKFNPETYTPQVIAIGPLHHHDERLKAMENKKLSHFKDLIDRNEIDQAILRDLVIMLQEKEEDIRAFYSETSFRDGISSSAFAEMILLDAIFIIGFFTSANDLKKLDPLMISRIQEDLLLIENQLPFFIIEEIYDKVNRAGQDVENNISFLKLTIFQFAKYSFFTRGSDFGKTLFLADERIHPKAPPIRGRNFIDLIRNFMLDRSRIEFHIVPFPIKLKYSAVMLHKARVKFQATKDPCLMNLQFQNGVLAIPRFEIDGSLERFALNLMAFEPCDTRFKALVCSYFQFMDDLINTAEDVDLLVKEGIIINSLADNPAVSNVFNNLSQQTWGTYDGYYDIMCSELNTHYENNWNHKKTTLKLAYFSNVWRGTGTIAAAILLILTLIKTIASVLSLFYH